MDAEEALALPILLQMLPLYVHRNHQAYHRDGEPRTATSTFTQLLSSEILQFNVALCPQRPSGLLGTATSTLATPAQLCRDLAVTEVKDPVTIIRTGLSPDKRRLLISGHGTVTSGTVEMTAGIVKSQPPPPTPRPLTTLPASAFEFSFFFHSLSHKA